MIVSATTKRRKHTERDHSIKTRLAKAKEQAKQPTHTLSKLAVMGEKEIDCRLEAFYPVERVGMDIWDFTRCLGILLDNAAEAALETETPWVEIALLSQKGRLSLRVSNPYAGAIDPDKIWKEGFSTKGAGRGLGLPGYQRILAGCPNAAASTSWADGVFVQELTVEEKA